MTKQNASGKDMTYIVCNLCGGEGVIPGLAIPCICEPLYVMPTGVTLQQVNRLYEIARGDARSISRGKNKRESEN